MRPEGVPYKVRFALGAVRHAPSGLQVAHGVLGRAAALHVAAAGGSSRLAAEVVRARLPGRAAGLVLVAVPLVAAVDRVAARAGRGE